jgi:hypothetical protein
VRHLWLLAWVPVLACSDGIIEEGAKTPGKELIPAEWTVYEDTSKTGEVTTASLQLPTAKDIEGLLDDEAPRLLLRCVDGKIEASIDREPSDVDQPRPDSTQYESQTVRIELDSAPACE